MPPKVLTPELLVTYDQLKKVRESKTVALKPTPMLREEIAGFNGKPQPLKLRYYQSQGIFHLLLMKRMVLGDGTGLGKCVTGDTLLATDKGLIPILSLAPAEDLQPNTFYEPAFPVRVRIGNEYVPVHRFYWNGEVRTYKVRTRDGFEVTGSANHPILVRGPDGESFCKLPEVEPVENYACIERRSSFPLSVPPIPFEPKVAPNATRYTVPSHITPELARLLGYIVAAGTVTSKYRTTITQHLNMNSEAHTDIRGLLQTIFGWSNDTTNADRDKSIEVTSLWLRQYFEACGVGYTTAHTKSVPWCVQQGTREVVAGFLRGLFEGDGSVVSGGVEFSTASERLGKEVQIMLLQFGIVATRKFVDEYDHTYWWLTLFGEDAKLFHDQIGFASRRKQDALTQSLPAERNPNKDVVPHARELVEQVRAALMAKLDVSGSNNQRQGSGLKQLGDNFQSKLKHVRSGNRNPTYAFLQEVYAACETAGILGDPAVQELYDLLRSHYYYDPIVEVIEAGTQPVMDIEVDDPRHAFTANGLVNHNTCQAIGALCYLWAKETGNRVIIVTPKSALRQWDTEIHRFATGIKTYIVSGTLEERKAVYEAWAKHPEDHPKKPVLLVNYHLLVRDWDHGGGLKKDPKNPRDKGTVVPGLVNSLTMGMPNIVTIYDEATAFKNSSTKTWQVAAQLSLRSHRCYGLTATLLKNNLMEGFSIYKAIVPDLFGTKTGFIRDYCVTRDLQVSGRRIPLVVGYRNLQTFRNTIDPFFLGRSKHTVSDELPTLITKDMLCELSPAEDAKYTEALTGIIELGDGEVKDYEEHKAFVSLIYCQQAVNSLTMLKFDSGQEFETGLFSDEVLKVDKLGAKEQALFDLINDELSDEKVIVYTRFASLVPRLQHILAEAKIKSVRITGKDNDIARKKAQEAFQNLESDTKVIFITDAGSEAINLQAASAMIFYDAPWSWGNYVQLLGRPIRIGSPHQHIVVYHLIAERPGDTKKARKTIDHHVLEMLDKKKGLIDRVLGEAAVGALDFEKGSVTKDLVRRLQGKGGDE